MFARVPVEAQTRATGGDIGGIVLDQTGGVLPGATVTATSVDTNQSRTAVAEANGRFLIPALPPGIYGLRAELAGFAPQLLKDLHVALGGLLDLKITLQVAATQEQITVVGEAGSATAAKTAVSTFVSQTQIEALPIDRRSFTGFTILTPAVTTDRIPQQAQGATPTSGLSFAGQRPRSNNVTVDGLDNNDITVGAVRATFSQDAVREFQVLAASFSAEFGKASGGIVNIVTRSGTNTQSGSLFTFYRDDALSARSYFERFDPSGSPIDRPRAPFSQLQAGLTAGGPVKKDRTFYFGAFERLKVDASNAVTIDDQTVVNHPFTGEPLGTPAALLRRAGFQVETGNVPYAVRFTTLLGRVDHAFDANHRLAGRFNWAKSLDENIETFGGITARSRAGALDSRDYNFAASLTSILGPRALHEFRVQLSNRDQVLRALDPTCDGPCDREDEGGPTVEIAGVASVGRQRVAPQPRASTRYQFLDTFNYYTGDHQIKAGADFNYVRTPKQRLPLHFGGRYIFAALPAIPGLTAAPLSAIGAFALGIPAAYIQGYGNPSGPQTYADLSLFVQDDWRLRHGVTLKAGLRYQHQFWWPQDFVITGYPEPYDVPADWNDIAPRLAIAWSPDPATTVHAGWGVFYDNNVTSVVAIPDMIDGRDGVRTLVLRLPGTIGAWSAPGRRLPEPSTSYPRLQFAIDPGLKTPFAHQLSAGVHRRVWTSLTASASVLFVRGFNQLGTIDYNPIVPALGAGRRPEDIGGVAGTSTSVLQYTSFGETSYRGLTFSLDGRVGPLAQLLASYTLSSAKDNSTDFQSAFIPQDNGRGRNPADPRGLPSGFDPDLEHAVSAQDQRHRLVVSGLAQLPWKLQLSGIVTVASGRRYTILAGADLNGDGDGGAFPSDRARVVPADPATSLARNTGVLPYQATFDSRVTRTIALPGRLKLEALVEVFNLFNRTNFTEINAVFGRGAYPTEPLPTFGRFEQAGPPRQIQIGARFIF
jgi:hypothetical protein